MAAKAKKPEAPSGLYVYALIDPRDGMPFYIGKGHGRRMFQHAKNVACGREKNEAKANRINAILRDGKDIEYLVLGQYETDEDAFAAEIEFIKAHTGLTNLSAGGDGSRVGDAKESFRNHAKRLLSKMLAFDVWNETMPNIGREMAVKIYGSVENCYQQIREALISEIENPSPNIFTVGKDGKPVFGWER